MKKLVIALGILGMAGSVSAQQREATSCEQIGAQYSQIIFTQSMTIRDLEKTVAARDVELSKLKAVKEDPKKEEPKK